MRSTDPLTLLLTNWARWCRNTLGCGPVGYQNNAPFENAAKPYKTLITEDEALEDMERRAPAEEPAAIRVELWVNQLPRTPRAAIRTHWVYCSESDRYEAELTYDQWQMRRAWLTSKRLGRQVTLTDYETQVGEATHRLRRYYSQWSAQCSL